MADTAVPSTLTPEVVVKQAFSEGPIKQPLPMASCTNNHQRIERLREMLGKK